MATYTAQRGIILLRECGCRAAYGEDEECLMLELCRPHLHEVEKAYGEPVEHLDVREFDEIYVAAKAELDRRANSGRADNSGCTRAWFT